MPFDKKTLAGNMRRRRFELDLSQEALAQRAGLSADLIWNYENETYVPGVDKAFKIAEALGVSLDELLGWGEGR